VVERCRCFPLPFLSTFFPSPFLRSISFIPLSLVPPFPLVHPPFQLSSCSLSASFTPLFAYPSSSFSHFLRLVPPFPHRYQLYCLVCSPALILCLVLTAFSNGRERKERVKGAISLRKTEERNGSTATSRAVVGVVLSNLPVAPSRASFPRGSRRCRAKNARREEEK
jgi:hypothetical protein